jgi:hypothetical protein
VSICANCTRSLAGLQYVYAGPYLFCSPMCRDTSEYLRRYEQMNRANQVLQTCPECGGPFTFDHPWECEKWRAAMAPIGKAMDEARIEHDRNGPCDIGSGCEVCSGAIRERAKGGPHA